MVIGGKSRLYTQLFSESLLTLTNGVATTCPVVSFIKSGALLNMMPCGHGMAGMVIVVLPEKFHRQGTLGSSANVMLEDVIVSALLSMTVMAALPPN